MGQLFSKKNREVFSTPLGMNKPCYRTGAGYLFCTGCNCQTGTCHRNGAFGNSNT